jgi:CRISPR-associated endonuclease Csn1
MKQVLGLDLGVSSIGWAYVSLDKENKKGQIHDMGVRIVPLTTDEIKEFSTGNAISTNKGRTMKRGARRTFQRFKLRREQLVRTMEREGWIPTGFDFQTDRALDIYALRAKAATERISLEELAKVLYMLNGKRGYQSNRKAQNEDEEGTDYIERIRARDRELIDLNITIGQKHYQLLSENSWARLKERTYSRKSYRAEFDQIWSTQRQFYPELRDDLRFEIGERILFYQRPLKSQKGLISKCTLETTKRVAPKSSPVFQEFKIWQQLQNLRFTDDAGGEKQLSIDDKKALFQELNDRGKMTTSQLKRFLGLKSTDPLNINFPHLEGNYTRSALLSILEKVGYDTHEILDLDLSLGGDNFDKQPFMKLWHLLYPKSCIRKMKWRRKTLQV